MPRPAAPIRAAAGRDPATPLAAFSAAVRRSIEDATFESLVLSKARDANAGPGRVRVRVIVLKGRPALSLVASHATRDVTTNLGLDAGLAEIESLLDPLGSPTFAHATLHAGDGDVQLLVSKKGKATLRRHVRAHALAEDAAGDPATRDGASPDRPCVDGASDVAKSDARAHDRARARRLPLDLPFLVELGLTDHAHRLVPAMARKWRQIDKFLEVLDHALDTLPARRDSAAPLRVVDYGCGKGYLTFAVHEHLRRRFGQAPTVLGVELRADLVDLCNGVAARAGCAGLSFVEGDLRSVTPSAMDVMIALHACDTATDHAIDLGVRAGAAVLVCSPCCHKELRPQLARPRLLSGLLRHGVHLGQEAEMVTDSMRALLLETRGYDAQVFEFVSLEHTSKNKMILARRGVAAAGHAARARGELADLKSFYGIREQCLERLLANDDERASPRQDSPQACQTP
jgi:SAM-dependent methyltransferase